MNLSKKLMMLAGTAASLTWLSGCFLGSDNTGPSNDQVKNSDSVSHAASTNLEASLSAMTNSQFQYGKGDLTSLRNSQAEFADAVRLNPANSKAQLGLAITGVLLAAQSNKLSTVINQSLDAKSPFDPNVVLSAPKMRANILGKIAAAAQFPEFHEIQDAIADTLLPALEDAISHLEVAYNDPNFNLTLTIEDQPRELDHGEAGVLLAGFHAIHGLLTLWLSYDIDIDDNGSYDYLKNLSGLDTISDFSQLSAEQRASFNKLADLLSPTGPFLAVKPAWKTKVAGVDAEIKLALDILKATLATIKTETDPQADDVIHICGIGESGMCIDPADYNKGQNIVDSLIKYMNQPYLFAVPGTDTTIKVDISAYFQIQDYKKLLPYYGFYDANTWSDANPVLYFTDASGHVTGNIKTLVQIGKDADSLGTPADQVITQISNVIHFQDPTFQGFLPGATEADIWNLLKKLAMQNQVTPVAMPKRASSFMRPHFALNLLGH